MMIRRVDVHVSFRVLWCDFGGVTERGVSFLHPYVFRSIRMDLDERSAGSAQLASSTLRFERFTETFRKAYEIASKMFSKKLLSIKV